MNVIMSMYLAHAGVRGEYLNLLYIYREREGEREREREREKERENIYSL